MSSGKAGHGATKSLLQLGASAKAGVPATPANLLLVT